MPRIIRTINHNYQQYQDTSIMSDHGGGTRHNNNNNNISNKRGATSSNRNKRLSTSILSSSSSPSTTQGKEKSTSFTTSFDSSTPFSSYFDNTTNNEHNEQQWGWDNTILNDDSFQSSSNSGRVGNNNNATSMINDLKMTSPSSLHSLFDYPRSKAKSMIGLVESKDNNNNNNKPIATGDSTHHQHQDLPNPTKIFDQVPFRNRFTSAALVSQRLHNNDEYDYDDQPIHDFFHHRQQQQQQQQQQHSPIPVPTQLFLTHNGTNHNKTNNSKSSILQNDNHNIISPSKKPTSSSWPTISIDDNLSSSFLSNLHQNEWPTTPNTIEDSFESFGNHSVFSDITGSITSPIRENKSKKYSIHVPSLSSSTTRLNLHTSMNTTTTTNNGEKLVDVQEEEEEYDDLDKRGVNHTASTHLESSYSDNGDDYDDEQEEDNDFSSSRNSNGSSGGGGRGKKQSRLASLFASRSFHHYNNDNESKRSKSAPKQRHEESSGNTRFVSSPERSYVSGSSSSGYVGWPGTIGKDGATVPFESSFSDDGFKPIDTDSINNNENVKDNSYEVQKKQEDSHDSLRSPTTVESNKSGKIKALGRKLFERKSSKLSGQQENDLHSSRVMALKQQYEEDVVDLDDVPSSDDEEIVEQFEKKSSHNPADIYLAKVVSRAKSASPSPCSSPVTVSDDDLKNTYSFGRSASYSKSTTMNKQQSLDDSTQNNNVANNLANSNYKSIIDVSASLRRVRSVLSPEALSAIPEGEDCFRLSEEALRMNERLSPTRSVSGSNVKGFRGFLDKTKDVPNLMDDESDSCTSASTRATEKHLIKRTDITSWKAPGPSQSNEFNGTMSICGHSYIHHGRQVPSPSQSEQQQQTKMSTDRKIVTPTTDSEDELNVVKVNNSLATIQTTMKQYNNRTTSAEFDANLTESDTDFLPSRGIRSKNQYSIEPTWPSTLTPSRQSSNSPISDSESELSGSRSSASLPSDTPSHALQYDLSMYVIDPSRIRKMVKRYRSLSNSVGHSPTHEDSKKAFALFEMRSRIMETDIERGINRRGWTKVVDDIVLTPYYRASHRVRDAVVVSKAWREGASPSDARTAFYLTTGLVGSYQIKRHLRKNSFSGSVYTDVSLFESNSSAFGFWNSHDYFWEKVLWVDETDFSLLRCSSLESGNLRGYDIFTEGDCQSILLKLTNDYCEVSFFFSLQHQYKIMRENSNFSIFFSTGASRPFA